jgi:large subunit ribosomal protein L10e
MVRKPNSMYRRIMGQAYTRKKYMGGIPSNRITQFDIGDAKTKFPVAVHLVANEPCQIRHTALEAARIAANRYIAKMAGTSYHLKMRLYPHNVLRENKIAVGAGADRISQGMRRAFGSPVGTAARVRVGMRVITISTTEANILHAKEALRKGCSKLPTPCHIEIETGGKRAQYHPMGQ